MLAPGLLPSCEVKKGVKVVSHSAALQQIPFCKVVGQLLQPCRLEQRRKAFFTAGNRSSPVASESQPLC